MSLYVILSVKGNKMCMFKLPKRIIRSTIFTSSPICPSKHILPRSIDFLYLYNSLLSNQNHLYLSLPEDSLGIDDIPKVPTWPFSSYFRGQPSATFLPSHFVFILIIPRTLSPYHTILKTSDTQSSCLLVSFAPAIPQVSQH